MIELVRGRDGIRGLTAPLLGVVGELDHGCSVVRATAHGDAPSPADASGR